MMRLIYHVFFEIALMLTALYLLLLPLISGARLKTHQTRTGELRRIEVPCKKTIWTIWKTSCRTMFWFVA